MEKPSKDGASGRGFSWLIAGLLLLVMFINYLDRQTLSVLVPYLPAGLKIDRKSTRLNSSHIQKSRMPSSA